MIPRWTCLLQRVSSRRLIHEARTSHQRVHTGGTGRFSRPDINDDDCNHQRCLVNNEADRAIAARGTAERIAGRIDRQMRTDFLNARGMEVNENGVTLHGFVARDPSDKSISLGRGRVRYALREVNGRRLLARTSDAKTWEPLWVGFGDLSIEPLSQTEADSDEMPLAETGNLAQIPESFRITLRSDDGSILWKEIIHIMKPSCLNHLDH